MSSKILDLKDAHGDTIDSVSADYEDTFTLESFEELIETFEKAGKSFVVARVTTADPKQPEKVCDIIHSS